MSANPQHLYENLKAMRWPESGCRIERDGTREQVAALQGMYDRPYQALGVPMPPPDRRDTLETYAVALAAKLEPYTSVPVKDLKMAVGVPKRLAQVSERIVTEALATASAQTELKPILLKDEAGRFITEFVGNKRSWMAQYTAPAMVGGNPETGRADGSTGLAVGGQTLRRIPG